MNNPCEEIFKRLENIEKMIAPVTGVQPVTGAIIFSMFSSRLKISSKGLFIGACFLN